MSPRFWIFGLILSIHILLMASGAWGESISFKDYQSRIQTAIEYLESGEGALQEGDTSYLKDLFPSGLVVQDIGGEGVRADQRGLLRWAQEEDERPGGRSELRTHLKSLLNQLSWQETRDETIGGSAWEEKRRLLEEVYDAREFRHLKKQRTPPWKAYLEERLRALGNWLRELLGPVGRVLPDGWIQFPLYLFILILGGILIVWIFRSVGPIGWRWRQTKMRQFQEEINDPEKDWLTWRGQALSKAQRGAFREAIRSLFVSVLMEGHHRGWWIYEPETTNREHLARVEGPAERRQALRKLTELYERSWYGLGHPGREEFRKCQEWLEQMGAPPSRMGGV
jgi:hypothetical protein